MKWIWIILIAICILGIVGASLFFLPQKEDSLLINSYNSLTGIIKQSNQNNNWTIEDNSVWFEDAKVKINITPHTSNNPTINLIPKTYTGEIDVVVGFDTEQVKPKGASFNPRIENVTKSFTCNNDFNYTLNPKHATCFKNWTDPMTNENITGIIFDRDFESGNLETKTVYWQEEEEVWTDVSDAFTKVNYNFLDYDTWYYVKGFNVTALEEYKLKLKLQPQSINTESYKYFFGVKPSDETLQEAIANGHFYYIDPWTESLNDSLLSYWTLDETSGTDIDDSNDYVNGTASAGVVLTKPMMINTGAYFSAPNYITFGDNFDFAENDSFSISMWFNMTSDGALFSKLNPNLNYDGWEILMSGDEDIEVYLNNNWFSSSIRREGTGCGGLIGSDVTTRHLVVTYDGSSDISGVKIYINGTECPSYTNIVDTLDNGENILNDRPAQLGRRGTGTNDEAIYGNIDEVAVYGKALDQDDIDALYNDYDPPSFGGEGGETPSNCWIEESGKIIIPPGCKYYTSTGEFILPT